MPIYVYEREDGTQFDVAQSIHDEPIEKCPHTGQSVRRVIQPVGLKFVGKGWYVTDYKKKEAGKDKST